MVESVSNAAFVMNPAVKYRDNPVIRRDQPWEGNDLHYDIYFISYMRSITSTYYLSLRGI